MTTAAWRRRRARRRDVPGALVRQFHQAFGFHCADTPSVPPDQIRAERAELAAEEFGEWIAAFLAGHPDRAALYEKCCQVFADRARPTDGPADPVAIAVESADVEYVIHGGAANSGFSLLAAFLAVHEANMAKLGPDGQPIIVNGKARKPPGWKPADVAAAIGARPAEPAAAVVLPLLRR